MSQVKEALLTAFRSSRIIFWYNTNKEFREEFEVLEENGFKKIHVESNEFEVKYIISKQYPDTKFLLYFNIDKPKNEENWLLDLELAHHVFHTDREAMYLQELRLDFHYKELISEHIEFFKSKERRLKLRGLLGHGDEHDDIRGKMLAVLFNTDYVNLITFIQAHGSAFIDENKRIDKNLAKYNLLKYYWAKIKSQFNYFNENPSIYDFLVEVFNTDFILGNKTDLTKEAKLLVSLWKDTLQYRDDFGRISEKIGLDIDVEDKLNNSSLEVIIDDDIFKLTELKIIHELVNLISTETISFEKAQQFIKKRENKFWYSEFEYFYKSLDYASETINLIKKYSDIKLADFNQSIDKYASELYKIDNNYRKFVWSYRKSGQNKILSSLARKIEKIYSNDWLLLYNDKWQIIIDKLEDWPTSKINSQQQFYKNYVQPFTAKQQRLFVIISDALRFECGIELNKRLLSENRYESSVEHLVTSLPSYTQLGMASLLPHSQLSFTPKTDLVEVDGMSSSGITARTKILVKNSGVRAKAIKAEDFVKMNSATEGRDFVKQHDLIYIYHNRIDKIGDDKTSEDKVFEAVEEELIFLMDIIKKIANMNGNNIVVTSDHGFIYQHEPLNESDYSISPHKGEIWKDNRRFVIGNALSNSDVTKNFKAKQLNISSEADILIPKSINRLRVKGAGSRFIHGGASMQEIVIPVLKVNRKRQDTTTSVDIDIIQSNDKITTNILAVSFIQSNLTSEQVLARTIRAAIYAEDGTLLSDIFKYNFNINEGSERQREVKHRFLLMSKASGKYKNQRVKLLLEEPVEGTTKWKDYKEFLYTLNISFTNDFDNL